MVLSDISEIFFLQQGKLSLVSMQVLVETGNEDRQRGCNTFISVAIIISDPRKYCCHAQRLCNSGILNFE